jgi:hypothetical protein
MVRCTKTPYSIPRLHSLPPCYMFDVPNLSPSVPRFTLPTMSLTSSGYATRQLTVACDANAGDSSPQTLRSRWVMDIQHVPSIRPALQRCLSIHKATHFYPLVRPHQAPSNRVLVPLSPRVCQASYSASELPADLCRKQQPPALLQLRTTRLGDN